METAHQPKLAVLGLSTMGAAMAGTALRSGLPLVVWHRKLMRPPPSRHKAWM